MIKKCPPFEIKVGLKHQKSSDRFTKHQSTGTQQAGHNGQHRRANKRQQKGLTAQDKQNDRSHQSRRSAA
jgi:hypothetical protein